MNKLGSVIEQALNKKSSETDYEETAKKKILREMDGNTKFCLLNGAAKHANIAPALEVCDSFLSILSKQSPAKVITHLYFVLRHRDITIAQGLATALSRAIILSFPTSKDISNLIVFFVPPRSSSTVKAEQFLRLHLLEKEGKGYNT